VVSYPYRVTGQHFREWSLPKLLTGDVSNKHKLVGLIAHSQVTVKLKLGVAKIAKRVECQYQLPCLGFNDILVETTSETVLRAPSS
jgi:hypothetical protein